RAVAIGLPHHITQRGNYRRLIFRNNKDRQQYLTFLREYSAKFGCSLLAYCLMSNHVHFIAVPERANALSLTFSRTHMRYSQYFNKKLKANGHLWQGRFYSCILDNKHLMTAAKYVERNPVRARMTNTPMDWEWSSNRNNTSGKTKLFQYINSTPEEWKAYTAQADSPEIADNIRLHTRTGKPLGNLPFIVRLENALRRKLQTMPKGRPKNRKPMPHNAKE
ncbi:MAG: transposase, partial [Elusimicrobia bacterium]|nr:transposase [Elusimicrobiota bacterium]